MSAYGRSACIQGMDEWVGERGQKRVCRGSAGAESSCTYYTSDKQRNPAFTNDFRTVVKCSTTQTHFYGSFKTLPHLNACMHMCIPAWLFVLLPLQPALYRCPHWPPASWQLHRLLPRWRGPRGDPVSEWTAAAAPPPAELGSYCSERLCTKDSMSSMHIDTIR